LAPTTSGFADMFTGAPLDVVKADRGHPHDRGSCQRDLFGTRGKYLVEARRIVFPLFCFAVACNLRRGTGVSDYVAMLLLLGVVSQPIYAKALTADDGNILFTLAVAPPF